jgi:AraC family transcriptional regulator of arabinose operon
MEDFNQIIESLGVKFIDAKNIEILQPIKVDNYYDIANTVIYSREANIYYGEDNDLLKKGDVLFIPSGRKIQLKFGETESKTISSTGLSRDMESFFKMDNVAHDKSSFSFLTFETKVFEAVNFFLSLDIPAFIISENKDLEVLVQQLIKESQNHKVGRERLISLFSDQVMIAIMRHIDDHKLFVEQFATNMTYFKDPRLLDIFTYIKQNMQGDLSNKALAEIANVSEDYVGQYFKMLTGINPQDYIEYQRMEKAIQLLRTSKRSIREIGHDVGYKDTAYFCRRFKMMFGLSAGKMRRRETVVDF